jgi:CHAD domain-containing protein
MGYKLKVTERIDKGIRRVIVEEIDEALEALAHPSRLPSIHEARKCLKRIRAALRLARGALGRGTFRRENDAFRDIGRRLSDVRDADVLVQAFDAIASEADNVAFRRALAVVGRHVRDRRRTTFKAVLRTGRAMPEARAALRAARGRVQRWKLRGDEWAALAPGFTRVYTQGQERCGVAYGDEPSSERFHAWRKRVKDLQFQVRLLRVLWPSMFKAWESDLETVADLLGKDHDLAMLRLTISDDLREALDAHERDLLLQRIDARRARLQADARPLGRLLYAESAKSVSGRIDRYWNARRAATRDE